jgi:hypothetical protein
MFTSKKRINIANSLINIITWMIPGFLISLVQCMISGVKNRPVRLPKWLLVALEEVGEPSHCIVKTCIDQYGIDHPPKKESHD